MNWLTKLVRRSGSPSNVRQAAPNNALASTPGDASAPPVGGGLSPGFEALKHIALPLGVAERSQSSLRSAGRSGNEGLVLWSGVQEGESFTIRTVTVPRQRAIRSADGVCVVVDGDALHQFNVETYRRGERLIAQVHTHPGRAYHSEMDDRYAVVTAPGGLSLVVPDFAVRPFDLRECAVYRLSTRGAWLEVAQREVGRLFSIVDG